LDRILEVYGEPPKKTKKDSKEKDKERVPKTNQFIEVDIVFHNFGHLLFI
jgi:hypothetical protein